MAPNAPAIYTIPRSQKDIAKIVWPVLGLFALIVFVSFVAATQFTAWKFAWHADLGAPITGHFYGPWSILIWTWKFNRLDYGPHVMEVFRQAHLIMGVGGLASLLLPVAYAYRRTRKISGQKNDLHGSAHWAEPEEVKAAGVLPDEKNAGGVMFGAFSDADKTSYLRDKSPEHMIVFAPTRSGKGVGIVIPTLLSWDESVLVHDIKGENWALSSGFREKVLKQRCLRFSPAEPVSARFNPLAEIRLDGNLVKDVQNIATIIVDPDGKGMADHWAKTGFDLLTGVILFVLLSDELKTDERNLATVQAIMSDGGVIREIAEAASAERAAEAAATAEATGIKPKPPETGTRAVMEFIRDTGYQIIEDGLVDKHALVGWTAASQAAQSFLNKASNEASGVLSTALSFLSLYRDPIVAENTSVSDFTIESIMQQKTSLFLVVPPSDKDRLKPLLRLIINQVVRRLTESMDFDQSGASKSRYPHRLLLLIDEFPSLGKLDVFQEAMSYIAGFQLKALLIVQDLSQLFAAYGKDESIMSNCKFRIAYAPNKIETAELLSKMSGQSTVEYAQRNYSGNRFAPVLQNVSTNENVTGRPLLTADECMRIPPDDEIVFVAGHAPIYCQKIKYYADPAFIERKDHGVALSCGRPDAKLLIDAQGRPEYVVEA